MAIRDVVIDLNEEYESYQDLVDKQKEVTGFSNLKVEVVPIETMETEDINFR